MTVLPVLTSTIPNNGAIILFLDKQHTYTNITAIVCNVTKNNTTTKHEQTCRLVHTLTHEHTKDGTASRDYSDYVITECWRGIERSYDSNMAILPVWKAWSRVHNEVILHTHSH